MGHNNNMGNVWAGIDGLLIALQLFRDFAHLSSFVRSSGREGWPYITLTHVENARSYTQLSLSLAGWLADLFTIRAGHIDFVCISALLQRDITYSLHRCWGVERCGPVGNGWNDNHGSSVSISQPSKKQKAKKLKLFFKKEKEEEEKGKTVDRGLTFKFVTFHTGGAFSGRS
jgi:hypothetical protein